MKFLQIVALIGLGTAPLAAQQRPVAVTSFETDGSVGLSADEYDALARSVGVLLASELGARRQAAATPVATTKGARSGLVDVATAQDGAKRAGAALVVIGTLLDQYGDLHLEARVLNALTGAPLVVIQGDPALAGREQLGEAIAELAQRLVKDSAIGGAPEARWRRTLASKALISFGKGLRAEAAGDRPAAATAYRAAIAAAPTLEEAKAALIRVGG